VDDPSASSERIDRRQAIKKSIAGAAAAGVVWSAPRIEGLSLRPNYAAAASVTSSTLAFDYSSLSIRNNSSLNCMGDIFASAFLGSINIGLTVPGGTVTINAVDGSPPLNATSVLNSPASVASYFGSEMPNEGRITLTYDCA
jgi:hypothetical protein